MATALALVAPGAAESSASAAGPAASTQIGATQSRVASLEATIGRQQQESEALGQRYDAAQQQLQNAQAGEWTTASRLRRTRAVLAADRTRLAHDAVNAYVYATPVTRFDALFTSPATKSDARAEYEATVAGDLTAAATAESAAQSRLAAQESAQRAEEARAQAAADQATALEAQNATATATAEATLQQVKGTLAQQVAAAAVQQAQQQAVTAAGASSAAQREKAAAAAQTATDVAGAVGGPGEASAATDGANQATQGSGPSEPATGSGPSSVSPTASPTVQPTAPSTAPSASPAVPPPTVTPTAPPTSAPAPTTTTTTTPPAPSDPGGGGGSNGAAAVAAAESQVGVPYVWGGEAPGVGFDCSGLTQWAWAQAGVSIPRTAAEQYYSLTHVSMDELQPGDLLFYFDLDGDNVIDHVVMYIGDGTVVAAPYTGADVSYSSVFYAGLVGAARP